ncbi:hypothetical protein GOM96_18545 [Stutzerimonas degradans]|nr:hypothetical protein GOM96_18545 [Stutzerimonas degradans]
MKQQMSHSVSMELMSRHLCFSTARSLDLMRDIDGTIEALVMTRKEMDALREAFEGLLPKVCEASVVLCEKKTIPAFEASQDSLRRMAQDLRVRLTAARRAPELRPDDGVVEAYEDVIDSISALNAKIEEIKWVVLEHNADLEKASEPRVMHDPVEVDQFLDSL